MLTQTAVPASTASAACEPVKNLAGLDPDLSIEATGGTSNSNGQVQVETPPPAC
jgi:hypothetical protein